MKRKNKTTLKSIRMNSDLANAIECMALQENRNFSNMAETLLMKAIDNTICSDFRNHPTKMQLTNGF
jgi:hypothetical protein